MTVGSLFIGIGGLDLALEHFGHRVIWQAESDGYARAVLAKHWRGVRCFEDVREIDATSPPPDIICGGFPCQDISNAGKRVGIDGERSGLWSEFARIIRELRPRLVFVENVAALTVRGLDRVLGDLASLGFDAEWDVLRAADVGAPHLRARIFILAYAQRDAIRVESWRLGGARGAGTALSGPDGVDGDVADPDSSDRIRRREVAGVRRAAEGGDGSRKHESGGRGQGVMADAYEHGFSIERRAQCERGEARIEDPSRDVADGRGGPGTMADADSARRRSEEGHAVAGECATEAGQGQAEFGGLARRLGSHWAVEPEVGRSLDGFSAWLDRSGGLAKAHKLFLAYGDADKGRFVEAVRDLRRRHEQEEIQRAPGGPVGISETQVLLTLLCKLPDDREAWNAAVAGAQVQEEGVRGVRLDSAPARSSRRRKSEEQHAGEPSDALHALPQLLARVAESAWNAYRRTDGAADLGWEDGVARVSRWVPRRVDRLRCLGNAVVWQQAAFAFETLIARAGIAANIRGAA